MVLDLGFGHWKYPNQGKGKGHLRSAQTESEEKATVESLSQNESEEKATLESESGLFLTLG